LGERIRWRGVRLCGKRTPTTDYSAICDADSREVQGVYGYKQSWKDVGVLEYFDYVRISDIRSGVD
jgi:hypothetical protein